MIQKNSRVVLNPLSGFKDWIFGKDAGIWKLQDNPIGIKGTVIATNRPNPRGWQIVVLWDNGLTNSYEKSSNLILVDDEC